MEKGTFLITMSPVPIPWRRFCQRSPSHLSVIPALPFATWVTVDEQNPTKAIGRVQTQLNELE